MTRRLLAAVCLAVSVAGGAAATPAAAYDDHLLCIGGDNQRKPGQQQGVCLSSLIRSESN